MTDRGGFEAAEKVQMLQLKHVFLVYDVCPCHVAVVLQPLVLDTSLGVHEVTTSSQLGLLDSSQSRFLHKYHAR